MAKEVTAQIKLQCPGGQATPAPPVGPALGQHGLNIAQFVKEFNDKTRDKNGLVIPVVISVAALELLPAERRRGRLRWRSGSRCSRIPNR